MTYVSHEREVKEVLRGNSGGAYYAIKVKELLHTVKESDFKNQNSGQIIDFGKVLIAY